MAQARHLHNYMVASNSKIQIVILNKLLMLNSMLSMQSSPQPACFGKVYVADNNPIGNSLKAPYCVKKAASQISQRFFKAGYKCAYVHWHSSCQGFCIVKEGILTNDLYTTCINLTVQPKFGLC